VRVRVARPTVGDPRGRSVELEHLRAAREECWSFDGHGWSRCDLRGPDGHQLERACRVRVAVARDVRLVEALLEPWPERDRELERLPRVAQVGLAVLWELARLAQRQDVRAHEVASAVGRDQPEC